MRLARVLRGDLGAVYDSIELPWSNGQAECQTIASRHSSVQCMAGPVSNCFARGCYRSAIRIEAEPA